MKRGFKAISQKSKQSFKKKAPAKKSGTRKLAAMAIKKEGPGKGREVCEEDTGKAVSEGTTRKRKVMV